MYSKTNSPCSVEVTEPETRFWIERKRILDEFEKMKLLFAYSVCPGLDLEFCQEVLDIDNPLPLIDALRSLGVWPRRNSDPDSGQNSTQESAC